VLKFTQNGHQDCLFDFIVSNCP